MKITVALMVLIATALVAMYGYLMSRSARMAEQVAVESLATESQVGVQWLRDFMRLPPARIDCAGDEIVVVLADMGCGTGGSIQVRLGQRTEALFEVDESSVYRVSGMLHRRYQQSLSTAQQERLRRLIDRWPRSVPAGRQDCLRIPSFPEAMMVCQAGQYYGIDQGSRCGSGTGISPAGELLDVLEATLERAPDAGPIMCI